MAVSRPNIRRKSDRLLSPGSSPEETATDKAIHPFDREAAAMERKWGYDKLETFVSPDLAAKYGLALGLLNEAIQNNDHEAAPGLAANCIKGLHALEAAALAAGHQPPQAIVNYQHEGFAFRIIEDAGDPTPSDGIPAFTLREVAIALRAQLGRVPDVVRESFPTAEVTSIKTRKPVDYANGGDEIPF